MRSFILIPLSERPTVTGRPLSNFIITTWVGTNPNDTNAAYQAIKVVRLLIGQANCFAPTVNVVGILTLIKRDLHCVLLRHSRIPLNRHRRSPRHVKNVSGTITPSAASGRCAALVYESDRAWWVLVD